MKVKTVKIAIAGVGTVGTGLLSLLQKFKKKNYKIKVSHIAARGNFKKIQKSFPNSKVYEDANDLVNEDNYDILVELIGGEDGISKKIIFNALKKKKNVVTANKALVSKYWKEISELTKSNGCNLKYEAAVAGGIPIIKVIEEFLISNKIKKIYGILNGTSNYILSRMLSSNGEFKNILKEAQKLGYAESDPTFDIDGTDTAHKLSILSSIAFNSNSRVGDIQNEGIESINLVDLKIADALGYKIKLLGLTEQKKKEIKNYVYPCLLSKDSFIAKIDGVYNGVVVESDFCNKSCFVGEGAGSNPTATSVLSDIIYLSEMDNQITSTKILMNNFDFVDLKSRYGSYYLRFTTDDKSGVISGIANEFKRFHISMKSMLQKEPHQLNSKDATIVITTHNCYEQNMMNALSKINSLEFIRKKTVYIRIENFK